MPRGNDVPKSIRNQIVGMRQAGSTFSQIAVQFEVKKDTAKKIYQRWVEKSDCFNAPRTGRPKLLTERDTRHIEHYILHDRDQRRQGLEEMMADLQLEVSTRTLQRTIENDIGLHYRVERKALVITST